MYSLIKIYILILTFTFSLFSATPEEIVNQSMEAYNKKDLDKFMELFDHNIEMFSFKCEQTAKGIVEVREVYKGLFESSPNLHSKMLNRTILGNKVIDHELITGRRGSSEQIEIVFIYEIENNKIIKTMLLTP